MKLTLTILTLTSILFFSCGQGDSPEKQAKRAAAYQKQIDHALAVNDFHSAATLTYKLIAKDTTKIENWKNLTKYSLGSRNGQTAALAYKKAFSLDKTNPEILELGISVYSALNEPQSLYILYNKLDSVKPSPQNKYQIATILFNANKFDEAKGALGAIVNDQTIGNDLFIDITSGTNQQNQRSEKVHIKAASLNILANIAFIQKDTESAVKLAQSALQLQSNFTLATNNLAQFQDVLKNGYPEPQEATKE